MEDKEKDWRQIGIYALIGATALGGLVSVINRIMRGGIEKKVEKKEEIKPQEEKVICDQTWVLKYLKGKEYHIRHGIENVQIKSKSAEGLKIKRLKIHFYKCDELSYAEYHIEKEKAFQRINQYIIDKIIWGK